MSGGDGGAATGVSGVATGLELGTGWDGEAGGGRVTKSRSTGVLNELVA